MTERTRWWRWPDLAGIIGILLLLIGAPALAEATQQDAGITGTLSFTTPYPRSGDHIEYDLVLQEPGKTPRVLPGILVIDRFTPDPGAAPVDVAFAERRVFAALDIQEPGLEVRMAPETVIEYYGTNGDRLHQETTWQQTAQRESEATVSAGHQGIVAGSYATVDNGRFGFPYVYGADFRADLLREIEAPTQPDDTRAKTLRYRLEYRGHEFYGAHHGSRSAPADQLRDLFDGPLAEDRPCVLDRASMFHPAFAPRLQARWDHGGTDCRPIAATLYSPHNAGFSGTHEDLVKDGEIIASMSLLPGTIEPGDGAMIPMDDNYRFRGSTGTAFTSLQAAGPPLPTITLGSMDRSDRPLLRGVGFDDLRALMSAPDAPTELQRAMSDGAVITGFQWLPNPMPGAVPNRPGTLPLLTNLTAPASAVEGFSTLWYLALTRPDGHTMAVILSVRDHNGSSPPTADDYHVCPENDETCGVHVIDPNALAASMADPHAILDQARAAIQAQGDWGTQREPLHFAYAPAIPGLDGRPWHTPLPHNWTDWVELYPHWLDVPYLRVPDKGPGFASWSMLLPSWIGGTPNGDEPPETGLSRSVELMRGITWSRTHWSPPTTNPEDTNRTFTAASDTVRLVQAPSTTPAMLGLFLVLAAAATRLWSALAAGLHFPVVAWLYAKIQNADVLAHERRAAIVQAVEAERGMTASEVARRLGYGWGSTVHHLQRLVQAGLLQTVVEGPQRFYVPSGQRTATGRGTVSRQRLLAAIEANPGATAAELAKAVDRRRASVTRLAARLVDADLVRRERDGRKVRFYSATRTEDS